MKTEQTHLIARYLQKTITADEETQLMEWVNESQANKKEFEAFASVWEITKNAPYEQFATDQEWEKLSGKLNLAASDVQGKSTEISSNASRYWLTGIAASVCLAVIMYFAISSILNSNRIIEIVSSDGPQVKEVELPDGSVVWLNSQSQISFIKEFEDKSREISLLEGEAFFEVKKDEHRPFIVRTGTTITRVLGTSFNLKSDPMTNTIEVIVVSGKVNFKSELNQERSITLTKGMKGVYLAVEDSMYSIINTDPNFQTWQNNKLVFNNTPVNEVLEILTREFKVEIKTSQSSINSCTFTSTFEKATLKEILDVLALSLGLTYTQDGKIYTIDGTGC